jgi:dGTPase
VKNSEEAIRRAKVATADDARRQTKALIRYSAERRKLNVELRKYLYRNFYYHPTVHSPNVRATKLMEELFEYFIAKPKAIGEVARRKIRKLGLHRAVCDYIAGMTDLYVMKEHERLLGGDQKGSS